MAQEEGLEVYSPREAIKMAGQLELIDDVELWLGFLRERNLTVQDNIGVEDKEYLSSIESFYQAVQNIGL